MISSSDALLLLKAAILARQRKQPVEKKDDDCHLMPWSWWNRIRPLLRAPLYTVCIASKGKGRGGCHEAFSCLLPLKHGVVGMILSWPPDFWALLYMSCIAHPLSVGRNCECDRIVIPLIDYKREKGNTWQKGDCPGYPDLTRWGL